MTDIDVLIAGAGPVGLSLAIELGQRGIRCLAVERNDRVGYSPRAKTTNVRTREHLRRWGIADTLRRASPIPPDYPPNVVFATRMNGPALSRFENAFNGCRVRNDLYSEEAQWVPQYTLEEVLRAEAVSLPGVEVAFDTELRAIEQAEDSVAAEVVHKPSGTVRRVRSQYLVGADGGRSFVRQFLGIGMTGQSGVARNYSIIFRAPDLATRHPHGPAIMYWMVNADVPGLLGPMDEHGLWFFMATKLANDVDPASVDPVELVRRGTGLADLPVEVVHADPWVAHSLIADVYSRGRIFLAGDACHLHPPFGGFGMNMGIGDAVDLGWKLAARLHGWGGVGLLDSYEAERRPVHERTIRESVVNYATVGNQLVRPALEEPGPAGDATRREVGELIQSFKGREFYTLGLVLGARYDDSPILVPDGSQPPPEHFTNYVPSACPGSLAPHAWLSDGSSLYDHFGPGLTLLTTGGGEGRGYDGIDTLAQDAERRGIPLKLLTLDEPGLQDLYQARFALIRPDQYVAWRGDQLPKPGLLLERVTGHAGGA